MGRFLHAAYGLSRNDNVEAAERGNGNVTEGRPFPSRPLGCDRRAVPYCHIPVMRMGVPYKEKGINIVSIAIDAPNDVISALTGKIGKLPGISVKAAYAPL